MPIELTVSLKGEDSSYKQKFLIYEVFTLDPKDPQIAKCIAEAKENFKIKSDTVKIKITMEL